MEQTSAPKHRSPWPACADCQVAENEAERGDDAPEEKATVAENTTNGHWGEIEPSEELGTRREEVRLRVQQALVRAHERAREVSGKCKTPEQPARR
jgi:hypothetical protein